MQLEYLESEGVPSVKAEHMAALSWLILSRSPEQMSNVVAYLRARGIKDVATVLFQNPKLLEYDATPDGLELAKGERSRIKVDVVEENGSHKVLINFYRVGTAFKTAPISPWMPSDC